MSFNSKSSRTQAKSTVNKLFANILPGSTITPDTTTSASANPLSTTELLHRQLSNKHKLSAEEIRKVNKARKIKKNKQINKKVEAEKKFQKLVKYNIIKNHKSGSPETLSEEEAKYLKKLVKKNSGAITRLSEVDDDEIRHEIEQLKQEILDISNDKYNKSKNYKDNKVNRKAQDFNEKIKKGLISVPGLTPGLAPVGLEDDSDDE